MELVLSRCTLRDWRRDDAAGIAKHANNRQVWLGVRDIFPHPYGLADAEEFLARALSENPRTRFCIDIGGEAVGGIGIHRGKDVYRRTAEIGYWLAEEFWGRGIMTEVVTAVTEYSFANFDLLRVAGHVFSNNPASARVLEKAGFVLEGRMRQNVIKDGKVLDSLLYAKTIELKPNQ